MTTLSHHAAAILALLQDKAASGRKPFMHGYPTALSMSGHGFSAQDVVMRDGFRELVDAGLVVEVEQSRVLSRYELVIDDNADRQILSDAPK